MSKLTTDEAKHNMDWFLDCFEVFNEQIDDRADKAMYVKTSDRIALFAIYYRR